MDFYGKSLKGCERFFVRLLGFAMFTCNFKLSYMCRIAEILWKEDERWKSFD